MKQYRSIILIFIILLIGWTLLIQHACGQQLKQIQKGTSTNQIPVTNGLQYTQVYRDAIPYILDTLGIRDSIQFVDSIFLSGYDLYYIKNGDTLYVGNLTDSTYVSGLTDSIYIQGDTIFLRDGTGFAVVDPSKTNELTVYQSGPFFSGTAKSGDLWHSTINNILYIYQSGAWVVVKFNDIYNSLSASHNPSTNTNTISWGWVNNSYGTGVINNLTGDRFIKMGYTFAGGPTLVNTHIFNIDTTVLYTVIDSLSETDTSLIYQIVSDTFALDMDRDSTNELQELNLEDNILSLTKNDSSVDMSAYIDVDSIYLTNYDLFYNKAGVTYNVGNVTDSNYIQSVVSDSIAAIDFPSDSTTVSDTPTLDLTMTGKNITGVVDTVTYIGTKHNLTLKEPVIAAGTTLQYWRGDKTWQTTPTGTVTGTGLADRLAYWTNTNSQSYNDAYTVNVALGNIGFGTTVPSAGARVHIADGDLFIIGGSNRRFLMGSSVSAGTWGGMRWNTSNELQMIHSGYNDVKGFMLTNSSGYTGFLTAGTAPTTPVDIFSSTTSDNGTYQKWAYSASPTNYALTLKQTVTGGNVRYNFSQVNAGTAYNNVLVLDRGNVAIGHTDATEKLDVNGDIRGRSAYVDATNSPGTSGQILSSTVTGTDWIDAPTGDITAVTVSAPITGGGTSGSVNIGVDTTASTPSALATQHDISTKIGALGAIGSTPNANAATISGVTLNLEPASASFGGVVTTGTQTFAGAKTFTSLDTDGTAPTTSGTTRMVICDNTGLLSFTTIPGGVTGSGTDNYIPRFNGTTAIENSNMYDDGTNIGIGNTSPSRTLHVTGEARITDLTTDITPTVIIGADATGVLESLALSNLSISGGTTLKGTGFRVNGGGSFNSGDLNLAYGMSGTYPTWAYSAGDFTFRLPSGSSGQVLKHDGTGWAAGTDTGGTGTVTSVAISGSDFSISGSPITTSGTIALSIASGVVGATELASTTVSAGSYTNTNLTVDADGRITSASNGSGISDGDKGDITVSSSGAVWNIDTGVVGQNEIATNGVGSDELASNSVASVEIVDGSVALADLATIPANRFIGSSTGAANIYLSVGTGNEIQSNQLTATTSHYGFLSDANGSVTSFAINTTPVKVDFDTPLTGLSGTMTVSSASDNITVTAAGGYEINYGVCISGVSATRQISIAIYKGGTLQSPTNKSFFITSGDEDCASGSHIMVLNASDVIDLRIATSASETVTLTGPQLSLKRLY